MGFFVRDPTGELVSVFRGVLAEFDNSSGGFADGDPVGVHGFDDVVVIIDATRNLAVGTQVWSGEESEGSEC